MKKIIPICIVGLFILSSFGAVALSSDLKPISDEINEDEVVETGDRAYTHTVLVQVATSAACPPCSTWRNQIIGVYESGDYDFEYVAMIVYDNHWDVLNYDAYNWRAIYGITSYPTTIMDGNYRSFSGASVSLLQTYLGQCGARSVPDIVGNVTLEWADDANPSFWTNISIVNNEPTTYNGYIRVAINEIVSRYKTSSNKNYDFGFLDWAFNKGISISPGGTYTDSALWVGSAHQDAHGDDFGDIDPDNIKVTMGIFNDENSYNDETAVGYITGYNHPPTTPYDPSPEDGQYYVDEDVDLTWSGGDPDPGDTVTYDVYFGTTNPPPLANSGITDTTYDPGTLSDFDYYWKIVATDGNKTTEGPVWGFTPKLPDVYMLVEDSAAPVGSNGLQIDVVGKWDTSLGAYTMVLNYDPNLVEFDHVEFTGTIGETASYQLADEPEGPGNISAGVIWIPATAGPAAGEGLLFKVFINLTGSFTDGSTTISLIEAWPDPISGPSKTKFTDQTGFGYIPLRFDGTISISDVVCGDADGSGGVDIDDVVYLISYIFSGGPAPIPNVCVGDADGSGGVDIDDVVYLISYIFSGGPAPVPTCCA